MALMRCPQCNTPITADEALSGMCLMCDAVLPTQQAAPRAQPALPPSPASPGSIYPWVLAVVGAIAFCFLPVGVMIFQMLPERTAPKDEKVTEQKPLPQKEPRAEVKPKPEPKPVQPVEKEPKKTAEKKADDNKIEKKPPPTPPEPKKAEPKKIDEPKVVEKKPEEPKKADPVPLPPRLANAYLSLLDDDAIKIDGDLADWANVKPIYLSAMERGRATKKVVVTPKTQKAYLAYCPKGLLVGVEVVDTSGELENAGKPGRGAWPFWDNDAIEIYIDTLNQRPQRRGAPNLHQFFAFPLGTTGDAGIGGYESRILRDPAGREDWTIVSHASVGVNPMLRAGKKTAAGWTMELLIPKSALRHGDLKPGQILGFELQIDTGTNLFYFWANDNPQIRVSTNPDAWGEVGLAGTDARIEVLDAGNKPVQTFVPGKPITVRVTDADMNLDRMNKEKINVTLLSKSGDRKTLLLEETGPNTGVFVGSMATRLSIGKREEKVLEVLAGESQVVEYLDLIRANSGRNVLLRAEFAAQVR
ncbi:MAG: hypothetical protein EXR98_11420 [Gemmataceae bacterium]|nr:hypothetical protein [Gemmataceae bacterium]